MPPKEVYRPKRCVFEATLACNMRCKHCGSRAGQKRPDELSTDEIRSLFRQLSALGGESVTIAGGEPMARADWPEVIGAAVEAGLLTGMLTNGIGFDDAAAAAAKERGLHSVAFSVDGPPEVHDRIRGRAGHFNRLVEAMSSARRAEIPVSIVSFVNRLNLGALEEMGDHIAEQGAFAWQIQLGTDMGKLHDHPELLLRPRHLLDLQAEITRIVETSPLQIDIADTIGYFGHRDRMFRAAGHGFRGCRAGMEVIGIESNGNVKGCLSIMPGYNERGADFVEGNIRETSLADIWRDPDAFAYNRKWSIDDLGGFCRTCRHADSCRGGCRGSMVASGDGVENRMCVYRASCEASRAGRSGLAAAVALATLVGGVSLSCDEDDFPKPPYGASLYTPDPDAGADSSENDNDTETTGR